MNFICLNQETAIKKGVRYSAYTLNFLYYVLKQLEIHPAGIIIKHFHRFPIAEPKLCIRLFRRKIALDDVQPDCLHAIPPRFINDEPQHLSGNTAAGKVISDAEYMDNKQL